MDELKIPIHHSIQINLFLHIILIFNSRIVTEAFTGVYHGIVPYYIPNPWWAFYRILVWLSMLSDFCLYYSLSMYVSLISMISIIHRIICERRKNQKLWVISTDRLPSWVLFILLQALFCSSCSVRILIMLKRLFFSIFLLIHLHIMLFLLRWCWLCLVPSLFFFFLALKFLNLILVGNVIVKLMKLIDYHYRNKIFIISSSLHLFISRKQKDKSFLCNGFQTILVSYSSSSHHHHSGLLLTKI